MTRVIGDPHSPRLARRKIKLEVFAGPDADREVVGPSAVLQVGTQAGTTLQLCDDAVSRIHLEISATEAGIRLRDLGSTNGTWLLGGIRISEALVPSGTAVRIGRTQLRIEATDDEVEQSLSSRPGFGPLLGESPAMRAVFALLERVAPTDETVLITGETGTGKELCARAIVEASRRSGGPLVVVDCGAMAPSLLESELFGHVRGAFTGAVESRAGAFERAQRGTVFLDEIGELPLELQTRLLRAVESRTVRRIGDARDIPLDLRVIAATNRMLEQEVNRGAFRADLYYRLSVVRVHLPPLRERPQDIVLLARHLLAELGVDPTTILDQQTLANLKSHRWPGNGRELSNTLRRLTLGGEAGMSVERPAAGDPTPLDLSVSFKDAKDAVVARFERDYLDALLAHTGGNISRAARLAQTDRNYLTRLLAKHGLREGQDP